MARGLACLLASVLLIGSPRLASADGGDPEQAQIDLRAGNATPGLGNRAEPANQSLRLATANGNLPMLRLDGQRENPAPAAPLVGRTAPLRLAQGSVPTPVTVSVSCPGTASSSEPSYWPLWVAVGVLVAAGVAVGVMYARQSADLPMPITTFGAKRF